MLGHMIWREKVVGKGERMEKTIDLSVYTDGVYLFKHDTGREVEVKRIVLLE
ncbi:hypothetical protein D3C86_1928160 [compost metagenome]